MKITRYSELLKKDNIMVEYRLHVSTVHLCKTL